MEQIQTIILNGKAYKITENAKKRLSDFLKYFKNTVKNTEEYYDAEIQISVLLDMEKEQKNTEIIGIDIAEEVINVIKENRKIKFKQKFYEEDKFSKTRKKTSKKRKFIKRKSSDKIFAGVCSGLADALGIDPVYIRVLFLILTLFRGIFIPVYIILWIIIPSDKPKNSYKKTISA